MHRNVLVDIVKNEQTAYLSYKNIKGGEHTEHL